MKYYWFDEKASGEQFFVGADSISQAWDIARENFSSDTVELFCYGQVEKEFTERMGYDVY